jgi:hypothetical protein
MKVLKTTLQTALAWMLIMTASPLRAADRGDEPHNGIAAEDVVIPEECTDNCCPDCVSCSKCRSLMVGVEATYLRPQLHDPSSRIDAVAGDFQRFHFANLDDLEAAPRVWLGIENGRGWGLRTRYWRLEANDRYGDVDLPTLVTVQASERLAAESLDLEATRRMCCGDWSLLGSFGARKGVLEHGESLTVIDALIDAMAASTANDRQFNGWGLTGGLEATRPICGTSLAALVSARGSVLWGNNKAVTSSLISDFVAGGPFGQLVEVDEETTLYVIEAQAGFEWTHPLRYIDGTAFARLVAEYQYWDREGETPYNLAQTVNATTVTLDGRSTHVDFIGLSCSIGFYR